MTRAKAHAHADVDEAAAPGVHDASASVAGVADAETNAEAEPAEQALPPLEGSSADEPAQPETSAAGPEAGEPEPPQQAIVWVGDLADAPRDGRRLVLIDLEWREREALWRRTRKHEGQAWVPHEFWAQPFSNLPVVNFEPAAFRPYTFP